MATTRERTGLLRRRPRTPEITTPPAGTVLPPHVRTGASDIPVTSVTPALPPGWERADAHLAGVPAQPDPRGQVRPARVSADRAGDTVGTAAPVVVEARPPQAPPTTTPKDPTIALQINALQAMCRQVFGFRLAMIALAAPAAILNAAPGLSTRGPVGAATVITFMGSYVLFRDWERFGPLLLRHPSLLAVDTLFGSLLLISAGPDTTLAYVSVCTPLLAGIVYGWRGAACFASLQSLILLLVYTAARNLHADLAQSLLLPGLCVIAGAVGSALRKLMLRFGEATHALTGVQARLAVTEAVSAERARLAREMHDTVAKTLHGVALAADGLAGSADADRMDAELVKQQAELVARSARRAAAESRELLADLRRESDPDQATDVLVELAARTRDFATSTGLRAIYRPTGDHAVPPVPPAVARQLLTITSEAMENAHRHAGPTKIDISAGVHGELLRISVYDDGRGLPPGTNLEQLRRAGHFGLVGMVERAASVGARIRIGRGGHTRGTEVRLELPLAALTTSNTSVRSPHPPTSGEEAAR
ncbi:sensor histidine kinase [Streptomyces sp. NPDC101152]|uniref:sensor histidine kinase n=1 Tax=Streptomyces sp. NPDC101152 TaxID=3366116 RepID=UPI00382E6A4A